MSGKTPDDPVVKIKLFPCMGSRSNPANHIYAVDHIYGSGREIQSADFMTREEAEQKYRPLGMDVTVTRSHGSCPDCLAEQHKTTRAEAIKKYYPNYRQ